LLGRHNAGNALAALAAARHAGVAPAQAIGALAQFRNVKRRMELRGEVSGIRVYDDFAHHPTAIRLTLDGLRRRVGAERIIAILEPRSNTMRLGVHVDRLADSLAAADRVLLHAGFGLSWDPREVLAGLGERGQVFSSVAAIIDSVCAMARPGDHVLVMSNGGFEDIHQRLLDALARDGSSASTAPSIAER
jgi:UDP-N-acetylmuramate: L-alanyl-gamma-D-glutamyl-meso-diaminopimelate ligase